MKDRVLTMQRGSCKKVLFALCAIMFAVCIALPFAAQAADKLTVKDGSNNPVFQVDETGVVNVPLGGVTIPSVFDSPAAFRFGVEENYSGLQGVGVGSQTYHKFYLFGDRARGTIASPSVPLVNDGVFEFLGRIYDGTATMKATAGIQFNVDGTVSAGNAPQRIEFRAGTSSRPTRMTIKSNGDVLVNNFAVSHSGGSAYVCVDDNGKLFTSESGCP